MLSEFVKKFGLKIFILLLFCKKSKTKFTTGLHNTSGTTNIATDTQSQIF